MNKATLIVTAALISFLIACKKDDKGSTCVAGTGGNLTLVFFPQHHGKSIFSQSGYLDTAYIKFNTLNSPGSNFSSYDMMVVGEAGEEHIHIPNMKCGDYYIYAAGFDTSTNARVLGGIPYSTTQQSGEIDINVPVTE